MTVAEVLDWHLGCYPLLQASDIYKLLHQGVYGPGHIIKSAAAAREALLGELAAPEVIRQKSKVKSQRSGEALTEPLDPDGDLVRVNLRPLAGTPGLVDTLLAVLVDSANSVKGDPKVMRRRFRAARAWCRERLPAEAEDLARLTLAAGRRGFPAHHHSARYLEVYLPAYRVVLRRLFDASGLAPGSRREA